MVDGEVVMMTMVMISFESPSRQDARTELLIPGVEIAWAAERRCVSRNMTNPPSKIRSRARVLLGCGHLGHPPTLPFGLHKPLDLLFDGGFVIFHETHLRSAADAISIPGIRSSVLAPCRDGDSEEIITDRKSVV